jgi:FkbM family methyltransferase
MISPYLLENRYMAVKRCKHGLFMYNRNDTFVGRGLDLYGEWCDFEIQLLRRFIKPGDTIVDVGANIGTHTVAFANLVGPAGLVHAFEPQRRIFHMLAGNVALNAFENVICHQSVVGDSCGEIRMPPLPPPDMNFNFGAVSTLQHSEGGEKVPLVTLDSLDLTECRVIKIDAEGMDSQVINGGRAMIERCQSVLYVENNDRESSKKLSNVLNGLGYAAWWSIFPYFDRRNFYSNIINVWPEIVPSSNLLCTPKQANLDMSDHEPFLGEQDDWKACMQRVRDRGKR